MSESLGQALTVLRRALAENMEWAMFNVVSDGIDISKIPSEIPEPYREFLAQANGLACGHLLLHSADQVLGNQYVLETTRLYPSNTPDEADWFVIGDMGDDPLTMQRSTGSIWYFPETGRQWYESDRYEEASPSITTFVTDSVAGPGYDRLIPGSSGDPWREVLAALGRRRGKYKGTDED